MLYLISYDVVDDSRRHKISEALLDYGRRVQFSVFECELDRKGHAELYRRLQVLIEAREDSCRWYRLCEGCRYEVQVLGKGDLFSEPGYRIV